MNSKLRIPLCWKVDPSYSLIGTRTKPGQTQVEYYNTQNGLGIENPNLLSNFANTQYGLNTNAQNVFDVLKSAKPVVPVSQITPQTPFNLPTPPPTSDQAGTMVAGATQASKSIGDYIKELTPPKTETQGQYDATLSRINELLPGTANKATDQLTAEQQAGVPQLKTQLADLNAQILTKNAEFQALDAGFNKDLTAAEGKVQTNQSIAGEQGQIRRMYLAEKNAKAAEVGLLQARALGVQGSLQAATETANRAVDLKYSALESELNVKMKQLELLQPLLNKEEKIQAAAIQKKYEDEQQALAEKKAGEKQAVTFGIENQVDTPFYTRAGTVYRTSDGKAYSNPQEAFADGVARNFSNAPTINSVSKEEKDLVSKMAQQYPDAGITLQDTLSEAQSKLGSSRIYAQETRLVGGGTGTKASSSTKSTVSNSTDNRVRQIIAANPNNPQKGTGWGTAADQIDAEFGAGTATKYDSWLKAHYASGVSVNNLTPLQPKLSPQAQAVINGTIRIEDLTPTVKGNIAGELDAVGFKSAPKLSTGQQEDLATMDTVAGQINRILDYNADGKLEGVGFVTGPLGQTATQIFGTGSEEAKTVRVLISNIKGTIAKLRGGTSFTPNEEKLLDSYTPSVNENAASVINKLALLKDFISAKKLNLYQFATDRGIPSSGTSSEDLRNKYNY